MATNVKQVASSALRTALIAPFFAGLIPITPPGAAPPTAEKTESVSM